MCLWAVPEESARAGQEDAALSGSGWHWSDDETVRKERALVFSVGVVITNDRRKRNDFFFPLTTDEFGSGQTMEQSQDRAHAQMKPGSKASGL